MAVRPQSQLRRACLCALVLWWLAPSAPAQVITTVAGSNWVFRGDGGAALSAPLGPVAGVAADRGGNLYLSDIGNHMVMRVAPGGALTVIAGNGIQWISGDGGPGNRASVNTPSGIALDASGNIYVADQESHRIRRIAMPSGIITTYAGGGAALGDGGPATSAQLTFPYGVAFDSTGNLYIAERHGHRLRRVTPAGTITTVAGTGAGGYAGDGGPATAARLNEPHGVAVDSRNNIYVADFGNQRVRRIGTDGIITTAAGNGVARFAGDGGPATSASMEFPKGVAVDAAGNLYISEHQSHRIRRVNAGGIISTYAGNGNPTFAGDGGPAAGAALNFPTELAVDSSGNLLIGDQGNQRVRRVNAAGTISTAAGNGAYKFSGDGAAATSASLDSPLGVAADAAGNFYIADTKNHRVRRVTSGGMITTVAGTGVQGFSGDGGPAASAMLDEPYGVALDAAGNIFIADKGNGRVRRVALNGAISTVAGGGTAFPGDGGPATAAFLSVFNVAFDNAGNLLIADRANYSIRRVTGGVITTVAGGGMAFPGDGGPATAAALNSPTGMASDASGSIYIADTQNNRIRRVSPGGTISTFAGTGEFGFSGDGGQALAAMLSEPLNVAFDAAGNLYIADNWNGRIRRVTPAGIIDTVAGGGSEERFFGDGGRAAGAGMSVPHAVSFDAAGSMYVADTGNDRIRKVLAAAPGFTLAPDTLSFSAAAGSLSVAPQTLAVGGPVSGLVWTGQTTTQSGGAWLTITPAGGSVPASLAAGVNLAALAPGVYRGQITVQAALAVPSTRTVAVELTVGPALPAQLAAEPAALDFETRAGAGNPPAATLSISNAGSGTLNWTARAETASGAPWLSVSAASGSAAAGSPASLRVSVNVAGLAPGVHSGTVHVETSPAGQSRAVAVNLLITQVTQTILISQSGLLFTGVEGGAAVPSQSFAVLNAGQGTMSWTATASTLSGGNWLSVTPAGGISDAASSEVPLVEAAVNATGLRAGAYSGLVRIEAAGASNSPQFVTVELNVLPPGANTGVQARPSSLVFTAQAGGERGGQPATLSPSSQTIRLATASTAGVEARTGVVTEGENWLQVLPRTLVVSAADPRTITMQPIVGGLQPGIYRGAVTLAFLDGSPAQAVNVLFVVAPRTASAARTVAAAGSAEIAAAQCIPERLLAVHRTLGNFFASPVGWPSTIEVLVVDNCGNAITNAAVVASFSNGDPPLALASLRNGSYAATWRPVTVAAQVTVTLRAELSGLASSVIQARGQVGAATVPALFAGGVVSGASFARGGALAPGGIVSVFGRNLARGENHASAVPLATTLGGVTLSIGGRDVPLFFSSDGQINAQVPIELAAASRPQVVARARRDGAGAEAFAVPEGITLAAVQPAIFTLNQQGTGQGAILDAQGRLVDASAPAAAGEIVQVFCTGLGRTEPSVASGQAAPSSPLARVVAAVEARLGGRPATVHFAGLAPGFVGLYQVNVEIPAGAEPGAQAPLVLVQNGVPSNTVTLAIR